MYIWGCIKTWYLFKWPKITLSCFFYSYRFLRWWAPCRQEVWIFQLSVGVKASLVESQQMSSFVFISFIAFHFAFISFHVSFHFAFFLSFCFHVLSCSVCYVCYQRYRSSKTDMLKPVRWVSAQTLAFFFIYRYRFCYRLAIVLEACAGCHLQASWTCTCISFVIVFFFTLIVFWAGNALAVLRCKPS